MGLFIAGLFHYPIKSCRGIALSLALLDAQGIRHDRRWMVVRACDGVFLTQRELPRMACIAAQVEPGALGETLLVSAPKMPLLSVPAAEASDEEAVPKRRAVTVWRFSGDALDEGDEAAQWFSDFLQTPCRLVRTPRDFTRRVSPDYGKATDRVGFADGYPLLAASVASLGELNRRLVAQNKPPVEMERFRPNLIVASTEAGESGLVPFAEDNWGVLRVESANGETVFRVAKPCARCAMTTIDPHTGEPDGPEPLKTLAEFRRDANGKVIFGMNLIHDLPPEENAAPPVLRVGDKVNVS